MDFGLHVKTLSEKSIIPCCKFVDSRGQTALEILFIFNWKFSYVILVRNTFEQGKFRESRLDPSFTARTGLFLFRTYWVDIIPILGEILKTLRETRISYVILAISVYLLSVLICSPLAVGLFCIGYDLKATSLVPIYYGALPINNITPADTKEESQFGYY